MTRRRSGVIAVVVALIALLMWFVAFDRSRSPDGGGNASTPNPSMRAVAAEVAAVQSASAATGRDGPAASPGNERVEVCGVGWVEAEADGSVDAEALMALPAVAAARERMLTDLRKDTGGMGEFVTIDRELFAPREGRFPLALAAACVAGACPPDELAKAAARRLLDRLATVASTSSDPVLYAFAYRRCERSPEEGACALLSAAQWSRLDPGNALPWLSELNHAYGRKDPAAIDDALFHLGHAERLEERPRRAVEAILERTGQSDVDVLMGNELIVEAIGNNAAQSLPVIALYRICTSTTADINRRQACDGAAQTIATKSDSLVTAVLANTVGRRLGWSDERLDVVDMLYLASQAYWQEKSVPLDPARPEASFRVRLDCKSVRDMLVTLRQLTRVGEIGLGQEWLASKGDSASLRDRARANRAERAERERKEDRQRAQRLASAAASSAASTPYSAAPPRAR